MDTERDQRDLTAGETADAAHRRVALHHGRGIRRRTRAPEALNNAVVHGNRLDVHKLVHVRCRCKVGKGISLTVSDQGQGFDPRTIPDPLTVENLEADHGRGIHIMKLAMDEVSFEQRGTEVHMCQSAARNPRADVRSDSRGF